MPTRLGLIVNPVAGKSRVAKIYREIADLIRDVFPELIVSLTEKRGDGVAKTRALIDAGVDAVACLGGDGTFREAAEALAGTGLPMAILPCGRGNDLPKSLFGRSLNLPEALEIIRSHSEKPVDIGLARAKGFSAAFANGLGVGFDATVAHRIDSVKGLSGFPLYLVSTLTAFRGFRPPSVEVEAGAMTYRGPVLMSGAGIGRVMGGGYTLFPEALMDDGLLDIYTIEPVSFFKLLRNIPKVVKGQHLDMPEVCYAKARSVVYRLKEETLVQMDGEVFRVGPGNLEITCERGALRIWVPNA